MSKVKKFIKLLEEVEFSFPTKDIDVYPFNSAGAIDSLNRKLSSFGLEEIQLEDIVADDNNNVIVTFSDYSGNLLDVVFSCGEEGCVAIVVGKDSDKDDEDNIVVDLDPLGVPFVNTEKGPYINLLVLDWLNKATMETILIAGSLLDKAEKKDHVSRDAYGNLIVIPVEGYEFDVEQLTLENTINEENGEIYEVVYKVVVRGGKKVRRPIVRRLRKKRLTAKQKAGLRKASRTRKSPKSKAKRRKSAVLRKRLNLKPTKGRKGFRVG